MSNNTPGFLTITVWESTTGCLVHSERKKTGSPSLSVVEAVSEVTDVDPIQLEPVLDDVIDTDALDGLFQRSYHQAPQPGIEVSFSYAGHYVTVTGTSEGHVHSIFPESTSAHQ